jgi:hypothetical protein
MLASTVSTALRPVWEFAVHFGCTVKSALAPVWFSPTPTTAISEVSTGVNKNEGRPERENEWSLLIYERRGGGLYIPWCSHTACFTACVAACSADLRPVLRRHMFHPGDTLAWRLLSTCLVLTSGSAVDTPS